MRIIMLGPPGSGKGTYSKRLSPLLGVPHISTGDIFREHIKNKTEIGTKVKEVIEWLHWDNIYLTKELDEL